MINLEQKNQLTKYLIFALLIFSIASNFLASDYRFFYGVFMFSMLAILIWVEKENLKDYNVDIFAILLFLLSGLFWWLRVNTDYLVLCVTNPFMISISIFLAIKLYRNRTKGISLQETTSKPIIIGIVIGIVISLIFSYLAGVTPESTDIYGLSAPLVIVSVLLALFIDLIQISIIEELLFGGFLWGYFRNLGWSENRVLAWTSLLFWVAHIKSLSDPYTFFFGNSNCHSSLWVFSVSISDNFRKHCCSFSLQFNQSDNSNSCINDHKFLVFR